MKIEKNSREFSRNENLAGLCPLGPRASRAGWIKIQGDLLNWASLDFAGSTIVFLKSEVLKDCWHACSFIL